ncbi:MAG: hypothetical protein IH948_08320 [Bacteroidetes bacterium]|nr:hypothetical protein [Bacteroidota bacterium]
MIFKTDFRIFYVIVIVSILFYSCDEVTDEEETILYERVKVNLESNNLDSSIFYLKKLVVINPENAKYHSDLGAIEGKLGNFEIALEHINKAILLDSNFIMAYLNRSDISYKTKNMDMYLLDYKMLVKRDARNIEYPIKLAAGYYSLKDYENSLLWIDRALLIDLENESALDKKIQIYNALKNYAEAIKTASYLININDKNRPAYMLRAYAFANSGQLDSAIMDIKVVEKLDTLYETTALINLARIYGRLKDVISCKYLNLAITKTGHKATEQELKDFCPD